MAEPINGGKTQDILPQNSSKRKSFKRLVFLFSYLSAVPAFVLFLILFSLAIKYEGNGYVSRQQHKPQFQALPSQNSSTTVSVESSDARIQALDSFFAQYDSPLEGHAKTIVDEADKYSIDYRLLPAIAMQESTLCKRIIKNSFNCWGFGIYDNKVTRFNSYDEAIIKISSTLAKKYIQQGYVSVSDIVTKYTPSDTGRWAQTVSLIMEKLKASI